MPSIATLEDLSKKSYKELSKMFYILEREGTTLKSAVNPDYYPTLTHEELKLKDIAKELSLSESSVASYRNILIKVGFEKHLKRGLKVSEMKKFKESVYKSLEEPPFVKTAHELYNSTKPSSSLSAFQRRLSILQKESTENPELEIRKESFTNRGAKGIRMPHYEAFRDLPSQPVYYLRKNIEKVGEEIELRGDVKSIVHRSDISKDLRRAVLKASIIRSDTQISKVYSTILGSKKHLEIKHIASKTNLSTHHISSHLERLKKLGFAKNPKKGYWISA